jgi:t-SNARE complex subunit (syntaxin)
MDVQMFVSEQGEVIDRIETAVENAAGYVDTGKEELAKAVTYKKAAFKKKICIIGIVLAVVVVIVLVIVLSVVLNRR